MCKQVRVHLCRHDGRWHSVKFLSWVEQADPHTNPPPLSAVKVKSAKRRTMMRKMKEWKPILAAASQRLDGVGLGWVGFRRLSERKAKTCFCRTHPRCLPGGNFLDWEGTKEGMKIEEEKIQYKKETGFPHSTSAAFPWRPFSQHCRLRGRLWCRVCIFDKVVATQKKAKRG